MANDCMGCCKPFEWAQEVKEFNSSLFWKICDGVYSTVCTDMDSLGEANTRD